jgi:RHS repeat-associated protein
VEKYKMSYYANSGPSTPCCQQCGDCPHPSAGAKDERIRTPSSSAKDPTSSPKGATSSSKDAFSGASSNNSVALGSGQFSFKLPLLSLAAVGQGDWRFDLDYLSGNGVDDIVGMGFNYTQNTALQEKSGGTISAISGNNVHTNFVSSNPHVSSGHHGSSRHYSSKHNNASATLMRHNMGTTEEHFALSLWDGSKAQLFGINSSISTPGRIQSWTDRYGNSQSFTWTSTSGVAQLSSVTDSYGRTATYTYWGSEYNYKLKQLTDFMGRQLNFQYDTLGHLIAVVLPSINNAASGNTYPGGTAYVFQYDVDNVRPQRRNDLIKIWYPNQTLAYIDTSTRTVDVDAVYASTAVPRYVVGYGQDPTDVDQWGRVVSETVGDPNSGVGGTFTYIYTSNPADLPPNLIDPSDPITFRCIMTDRNGNQSIYDFNSNEMLVHQEQMQTRDKNSLETGPWVAWTKYNAVNQPLLEIMPAGNSIAYIYDSGMVGSVFYAQRRGLLLSETHYPGNELGINTPFRSGSNGQTQLTRTYFYDPIFNQECAMIEERGNPITVSGSTNVYFTPQNGGTTPTDSDKSRYATFTIFDYQKNQNSTILTQGATALGLTTAQIQTLIEYVNGQMTGGALPSGFQTNLGDINGDGTGDGDSSELDPAPMLGNVVKIQYPSVYQLVPSDGDTPWAWQTQVREEVYTNNNAGQMTTKTDAEGNVTVYVHYPESNPDGNSVYGETSTSNKQYGLIKQIYVDADPSTVMDLLPTDESDLASFTLMITRTNTPGVYQELLTEYEGSGSGSGCTTCAYDPLGNPLAVTDPRGFTTSFMRTEMGEEYLRTAPAPYSFQVQTYYDANRNINRVDTQDQQVEYTSSDPSDAGYAHFVPTGNSAAGIANVPMQTGPTAPGGTVRYGWLTNLFTYNILDDKIEDDTDATGSTPATLVTTYTYDANQNLISVTKPDGNVIAYDYDERDLQIATAVGYVSNSNPGAVTVNVYDANGNLLDVIGPANRGGSGTSQTVTINDAFNSSSSLTHTGDWLTDNTYDGFDRVIQVTDSIGGVILNSFDPGNRIIQQQQNGYANGTTPTDRTGTNNVPLALSQTRFDEAGRGYEVQKNVFLNTGISGGSPTHTLPNSASISHTGGGLAANSTTNSNTGTITLTTGGSSYILTRYVFDRTDRITATATDNGAITTMAYDGANRMIQQADPLNNLIKNQYDGNGNVISTTSVEVCTITSPTVANETFEKLMRYDCMNKLVLTAQPGPDGSISNQFPPPSGNLARISLMGYDSRGNTTITIDENQNSTANNYDGASRRIETTQYLRDLGEGSESITGTIVTTFQFDGNSNRTAMVDDNGGVTMWTYDLLDRVEAMVFNDGSTRTYVYDLANDITTYTDENGSVFANSWDPMGRKVSTAITPASGIGGTTSQSFQYDGMNRQTFARDSVSSVNADSSFYYDSLSRTVQEGPTVDSYTVYMTNQNFTSLKPTSFVYPTGGTYSNVYDALYRRTEMILGSPSLQTLAAWEYFGPQRVAEVSYISGIIQTMMNNARTHSAAQYGSVTNPAWGTPSSDRLGYDGSGRMIAKRFLAGGINESTYAYNNTTPVVATTTAFDPANNKFYERPLQAESRSHLYQPFSYGDPQGGFDSVNRLLIEQRGTLSSIGGYMGNGGGSVSTAITLPNTNTVDDWTLDGLGNWTELDYTPVGGSASTDQRNHNKLNEITQRTINGGTPIAFSYDGTSGASNGNLANDGTLIYAYDALNRLIQVNRVTDGAVIANYAYDTLNRRVMRAVSNGGLSGDLPAETLYQAWFGQSLMQERRSSDNDRTRYYLWGNYIDELIQIQYYIATGGSSLPAGAYYPLQDNMYRTAALTDQEGNIVEAYDMDAYGNTLTFTAAGTGGNWWANNATQSDQIGNRIIYCGYMYDPETQLYYVRNRHYNPSLGRWVQRDLINYHDGPNLYQYVNGIPEAYRDPLGLVALGTIPKPNWTPIPCTPDAKEGCVDNCKAAGFAGACTEKTQCFYNPDSDPFDPYNPTFPARCDCKLNPCDFYQLWCKWGIYHGHAKGGWVRSSSECNKCYQNCKSGAGWCFKCCPMGKKGGKQKQFDWSTGDQGCVEPDQDIS